mgnify:CR=1 FL=1
MIDPKTYQRLKDKVDSLEREEGLTTGALSQLANQLKDDLGCNSVEEAEAMLERLETEYAEMERKYEKSLRKFEEAWSEKIRKEKQ